MKRGLWVASIACVAYAFGQTRPTSLSSTSPATMPTSTTATATLDEAKLEVLISRLNADDWRAREAATKELVALGPDASPRLNQLIAETKDEEVRTRAAAATQQIGEAAFIGPSVVTLHLKDASAKQAFAELAKQCGVPGFRTTPDKLLEDEKLPTADLDLVGVNYFVAMDALAEKYGLRLINSGDGLRLMRGMGNGGQMPGPQLYTGAFRLTCNSLSRSQTVQLREPGADGEMRGNETDQFYIQMTLSAEPKIIFAGRQVQPKLDECTDDLGNSLKLGERNAFYGSSGASLPIMLPLSPPKREASTIKALRGSLEVSVVSRVEVFEVGNAVEATNVSKDVAGRLYTFKSMKRQGDNFTVSLSVSGGSAADGYSRFNTATIDVSDADGKILAGIGNGMNSSGRVSEMTIVYRKTDANGGETGDPVKFVWRLPAETRTVVVPFDFKNIPLPK